MSITHQDIAKRIVDDIWETLQLLNDPTDRLVVLVRVYDSIKNWDPIAPPATKQKGR